MAEFTPRFNATLRTAKLAVTAAALFGLAGTPGALAQSDAKAPPRAQPPTAPAVPATPAAQQPQQPRPAGPGSGKLIRQAGTAPAGLKANQPAGEAPAPAAAPNQPPADGAEAGNLDGEKVKVDEHLIVDLHVNDEDLANVLQMLSIQSQKNIVTSKSVSAVVTANLYGVTFYEALDAILHVNGYGYIERGNFIYVYTLDEIMKIEAESRSRVWKVVKLNYLNSTDAAEFVKPLLSEGGQIKTNGKAPNFQINENAPGGAEDYAHESTMMVFDYEENLSEIEKVVKELDSRPTQVLVEATILQTSLNEANAFGVDFSVIADMNFSDFVNVGGPLEVVNGLIRGNGAGSGGGGSGGGGTGGGTGGSGGGSTGVPIPADGQGFGLASTPGNTAGRGTLKVGLVWNDVAAFIKMLDEVADTTIISRPNILTLNRQPARVLVGRKVGYLNSTTTDTATTQTVEFLDTGTQLYFRPFVSNDGSIRMELKPKVSEAVIRNTTSQGGQTVTIPDELSNELTTNVIVKDGQTIVLGGLFRENTQTARRQVPGLGDIPVIGAAFRGHDDSVERNEVIFMVTPTILSDASATEQGKRGEAMVERVRAGSREGLLLWSREKRCQQMVMEATRLAEEGKRDEALSKVQRALRLSHNQPDAIQLREELMNQKSNWPTRSMQHEIISGELEKQMSGSKKAEADLAAQSLARRQGRPAPAKPAPTRAKAPEVAVDAPGKVFFTEEPKVGEPEPVMAPPPVEPEPNEPAVEPLMPAPIPEPAPEPAAEPGAEPTPDPAADPMGGAPEPAPEPATEPTPEPAPAPAPQPPKSNDPGEGIQGPHSAATNWKTYTVPAKSNANLARLARAWHGAPAKSTTQPKAVSAAVR